MKTKFYLKNLSVKILRDRNNIFFILLLVISTIMLIGSMTFKNNIDYYIEENINKNIKFRTIQVSNKKDKSDFGKNELLNIEHVQDVYNSLYGTFSIDSDFASEKLNGKITPMYLPKSTTIHSLVGSKFDENDKEVAIIPRNFYPDSSVYNFKIDEKNIIDGESLIGKDFTVTYYTKKFENMIKKIGGVKNYMTVNGRGMVSGSGENVAMAIVELDDWDKRTTEELSLSSIVRRIQEGAKSIPEANIMAFTPPAIWNIAGGAEMVQNIFNGNRNMNAIEQAVSELRSARSQISEYEQKAYAELTTAHLNLEKSKKQYEVALAAEKVAKENLDLVTERFNVGKVSALERTDAQVSYTSAQADALSAKYDWQDALATIAYLTGGDVKSEN